MASSGKDVCRFAATVALGKKNLATMSMALVT